MRNQTNNSRAAFLAMKSEQAKASPRAVLHGGAALAALVVAVSGNASASPDFCAVTGLNEVTCSGDQSAGVREGVDFPGTTATLTVNQLTQDITPVDGGPGVFYDGVPAIVDIDIDTGPFRIATFNNGGDGVFIGGMGYQNLNLDFLGEILTTDNSTQGVQIDVFDTEEITATVNGAIETRGNFSSAIAINSESNIGDIFLTSISELSTGGEEAHAIRLSENNDGSIIVDFSGAIATSGGEAAGIRVREFGIGDALVSTAGAIATFGDSSNGINIQEFGDGGVSLVNEADITTNGSGANGVYVSEQDGGNVNIVSAANIATQEGSGIIVEKDESGLLDLSSAGDIAVHGDFVAGVRVFKQNGAGLVGVRSEGAISTNGQGSRAISIVDDGSGSAFVTVIGALETAGDLSDGVFLQEGANGDAVVTFDGAITTNGLQSRGIRVTESGDGDLLINSGGDITTAGMASHGISATENGNGDLIVTHQGTLSVHPGEISGSGIRLFEQALGDAFVTFEGAITTAGDLAEGIAVRESGIGNVSLIIQGDISTNGMDAFGVVVEEQDSGDVSVSSVGNVFTAGAGADGFLIEKSGNGLLELSSSGDIATQGDGASGLRIFKTGNGSTVLASDGFVSTAGASAAAVSVVHVGSDAASVNVSGIVETDGDASNGVDLTKSGEGDALVQVQGDITTNGVEANGIRGALSFSSGDLLINAEGDITALGPDSIGILAEDFGASNILVEQQGNLSVQGTGIKVIEVGFGDVTVNGAGAITTSGIESHGVDIFIGNVGNISIAYDGEISAGGADAHAVLVSGPGMNTVSLNSGVVQGGSGSGAGVMVSSPAGAATTINNGANVSALSGLAVRGGDGDEMINNGGTVTGDVLLGGGANAFNNVSGGVLYSSNAVALGAGGVLTNEGIVNPGSVGVVQSTVLDGDYVQTAGGVFSVDVGMGGDLLEVSGAADLAGAIEASYNGVGAISQEITILSAAGGVTDNGLSLQLGGGLDNSFLFDVELLTPNPNDVVLAIDFSIPTGGLNPNQTNIAEHMLQSLVAGDGLQPVLNGLVTGAMSVEQLQGALDQLSPEIYLNTEKATLFAAEAFADSLFGCGRPGSGRAVADEYCIWLHAEARTLDEETTTQNIGFDEDVAVISGGVQYALAPALTLGAGVNYESGSLEAGGNAEANVDRVAGGVSAHYHPEPVSLYGVAFAGMSSHGDVRRSITFGDFAGVASGEQDIFFAGAGLRADYHFERGRLFAKPSAAIDYFYLDADDVIEIGADAARLNIEGGSDGVLSTSSALEIGAAFEFSSGLVFQPFIKPGVSFITGEDAALNAAFAANPGGVTSFLIRNDFEDVYADIEAGAVLFGAYGVSAEVRYIGRFSRDNAQQGVAFKASYQF